MKKTKVVSHRGANHLAPENTFAAADKALENGASYIELDVRESLDGVLYVHHDPTLDRTTNGSGLFCNTPAAEIDALDAGGWFSDEFVGQPVPRLDAYLDYLRTRAGVYVELKSCDPAKVVDLVRHLGMTDSTFYFSFDGKLRSGIHGLAPQFRQMITLDIAGSPDMARSRHHASILEFPLPDATPELLDSCRRLNMETMIYYGGNDPKTFEAIAMIGVDYVNLDHPDRFRAAQERVTR